MNQPTVQPDIPSRFLFAEVEKKWCAYWEDNQIFHAQPRPGKKSFTIVIPPPNVTGILHMGHALNNTLQDIMIRHKKMQGYETCWVPGTDHAGIATQNVVEKELAKEGRTRYDVGREELLRRLWDWRKRYGDTIIQQLKKLGAACDWQRTRFTMDEHYSEAVKHVFVHLYEKGIIYRGQYIINWCPRCQTALSDEEAEHKDQQGTLYHIRYPRQDQPREYVVVATTRPETMLGDTAVAVHPQDDRYRHLIGSTLTLPLANREIKIVADEHVDPEFGTGAVKVTPAHDPNDFEIGQRHHLERINILHPDGRLNAQAGEFAGMDRFEAREAILENLKDLGLLEKTQPHQHAVGHCYRCHTVVEPYLSQQWFVRMKTLAQPATQVVQDHQVRFIPQRWTKVYLHWMENIRDWCISRQIWWGHRIPVWYCQDCPEGENVIVTRETPTQCPRCSGTRLKQDEDVLDTWFSSWLWPFATFGWPNPGAHNGKAFGFEKEDLAFFYPTGALFTATEIIFFWVARMIMAGLEFVGEVPFRDVYFHGTVRDAKGIKMSKSLGNAIDPLEIIAEYGADALRFSLIINSGQDLFISKDKFEIGRNFANKIWNASRFVLMNDRLPNRQIDLSRDVDWDGLDLPSRWIISQLYSTLEQVQKAIENYRFSEAENLIYEFFWRYYCDWYLEIVKPRLGEETIQKVLLSVLEQSVRMMHPFVPFVTEEIWDNLNIDEGCLAVQPWPEVKKRFIDKKSLAHMQVVIDLVSALRNVKAQWNINPKQDIDCVITVKDPDLMIMLRQETGLLQSLLRIRKLELTDQPRHVPNSATGVLGAVKFIVPLRDVIDVAKEKQRLQKEIDQNQRLAAGLSQRLQNHDFLKKAPADVVNKERIRLTELENKTKELIGVVENLDV